MKKLITSICILLISCLYCAAEGSTTRLYCICDQEWWNADDAAVAIYAYSEGGVNNAAWPGERMTKTVELGTSLWTAELTGYYTNVIFVRVNGSGTIEDWGAQTQDLTIPTDGRNLYTITSTEAVWGDPGVEGEWSIWDNGGEGWDNPTTNPFGDDSEALPTVAIVGSMNEWDATANMLVPNADSLSASITIHLDMAEYEFKIVVNDNWLSLNGEGSELYTLHRDWNTASNVNMENATNFKLIVDVTGEYIFTWTYADSTITITFPEQTPVVDDHAYYLIGENAELGSWNLENAILMENDSIELFLPAGFYKFKILPQNTSWDNQITYQDVDHSCSSENVTGDSLNNYNINAKLSEAGPMTVKMVNGKVCVTGTFSPTFLLDVHTMGDADDQGRIKIENGEESIWATKYYAPGATATIQAIPFGSYTFSHWSDGNTDNPRQLIINESTSLSAIFVEGEQAYYLIGSSAALGSWSLDNAQLMDGDSIVLSLPSNAYEFLVLPQSTSWNNALGYNDLNIDCSSAGLEKSGTNNIKFILADDSEVRIRVVDGLLCVNGVFGGEISITGYSVVGDEALFGLDWNAESELTEMTEQEGGIWTFVIDSVQLQTEKFYYYKIIANHTWSVAQYPDEDNNYSFTVDEDGAYSVVFRFTPEDGGSAIATLINPTGTPAGTYYLIGDAVQLGEWNIENALPMENGTISLELPAGSYAFKVLPQNTVWEPSFGYTNVAHDCSSDNVRGDEYENITITMAETGLVTISVTASNTICVSGNFINTTNSVYLTTGITPTESGGYVSPSSGEYEIGSSVQLEARISVGGWMFDHWSDNDSWDNPRTITLTQDTTITAIFSPGEYGVLVNGNRLFRGTFTERLDGSYIAQFLASVEMQTDDYFQLINLFRSYNTIWRPQLEEGGLSGDFSIDETHNAIVCNAAGCYNIYMKIHYGQSDDVVYIDGGSYCSDGEPFEQGETTSDLLFSLVGTANLFRTEWDIADTLTNMMPVGDGRFEYTLDSVTLTPEGDYQYKVIANHQWNIKEYPSVQEDDNYHIYVEEPGVYSVLFSLDTIAGCYATTTYLHDIIDYTPSEAPEILTFALDSTWRFIMLPGVFGLNTDDVAADGELVWAMYDAERRAAGRSGWTATHMATGFSANQAYIVRAAHGTATMTVHVPEQAREKTSANLTLGYYDAGHEMNANWNFLGNPYPFAFDIMAALEDAHIEAPIAVWNGTGYTAYTPGIDEFLLEPLGAFFIQLPNGGPTVLPLSPEYIAE